LMLLLPLFFALLFHFHAIDIFHYAIFSLPLRYACHCCSVFDIRCRRMLRVTMLCFSLTLLQAPPIFLLDAVYALLLRHAAATPLICHIAATLRSFFAAIMSRCYIATTHGHTNRHHIRHTFRHVVAYTLADALLMLPLPPLMLSFTPLFMSCYAVDATTSYRPMFHTPCRYATRAAMLLFVILRCRRFAAFCLSFMLRVAATTPPVATCCAMPACYRHILLLAC